MDPFSSFDYSNDIFPEFSAMNLDLFHEDGGNRTPKTPYRKVGRSHEYSSVDTDPEEVDIPSKCDFSLGHFEVNRSHFESTTCINDTGHIDHTKFSTHPFIPRRPHIEYTDTPDLTLQQDDIFGILEYQSSPSNFAFLPGMGIGLLTDDAAAYDENTSADLDYERMKHLQEQTGRDQMILNMPGVTLSKSPSPSSPSSVATLTDNSSILTPDSSQPSPSLRTSKGILASNPWELSFCSILSQYPKSSYNLRKPIECNHCTQCFNKATHYAEHLDRLVLVPKYDCPVPSCLHARIGFLKKMDLKIHISQIHLTKYNGCKKTEEKSKVRDKFGPKVFDRMMSYLNVCNVESCGRAFYRKDSLNRHMKLLHPLDTVNKGGVLNKKIGEKARGKKPRGKKTKGKI